MEKKRIVLHGTYRNGKCVVVVGCEGRKGQTKSNREEGGGGVGFNFVEWGLKMNELGEMNT